MREGQREALGIVISCLGIAGMLAGFPGLSGLLQGTWGYVLFGGAVIGALLYLILTLRLRKNILLGFISLGLIGALAFGSTYEVMWYFMTYMPTHGGLGLESIFEIPSNARNSFVTYLKSGNFDKAYELLTPDAQNQIPDADTFGRFIKDSNWQPTKWKWSSEEVEQEHAHYFGEATYTDNRTGIIELWLEKIEKRWKVSAMNFRPQ